MANHDYGEFREPILPSIVFGLGSVRALKKKVDDIGANRILLITGQTIAFRTGLIDEISRILEGKVAGIFNTMEKDTPRERVLEGAATAREVDADMLISIGGGSVIDGAKGINIVVTKGYDLDRFGIDADWVEACVPRLENMKLSHFALPTTISGAEFSETAGITNPVRRFKELFRGEALLPKVVILDPHLTSFTPSQLWISGCIKCLADCFEQICAVRHNPIVDAMALHGIRLIYKYLGKSVSEPLDLSARGILQFSSYMSHYGARSVGVGMIGALRHQIAARHGVAHGIASAIVFPHCISFYRPEIDDRLSLITGELRRTGGGEGVGAQDAVKGVKEFIASFGLPIRLRDVGIRREDLEGVAEAVMKDRLVANSPKQVNSLQIVAVLENAW